MQVKPDLPRLMAVGPLEKTTWADTLSHAAVPSASGFRGKDHISPTQPEPSGVNKVVHSSSPECFGLTHQHFQSCGTTEYLQALVSREVSSQLTEYHQGGSYRAAP